MIQPQLVCTRSARRCLPRAPGLIHHLIAICCLVTGLFAQGQTSDENEKRCADPAAGFDVRIGACTALIQSGGRSADYLAIAYNDRGNGYKDSGDYDRAIQDYGQAIQLKPDYALAFYNRGNASNSKGEYDRAIHDYDQAIRLEQNGANAFYVFYGRGYAYNAKGDYERAVQDYDQAIRLKPDDANAFMVRGIANFLRSDFTHAVLDFQRGGKLNPTLAYDVLWLHLARERLGQNDKKDLARRFAKADHLQWPTPVLEFLMGRITEDRMLAAASNPDTHQQRAQICEANFFAGEAALLRQNRAAAQTLFEAAMAGCPKTNLHYDAAAAELRELTTKTAQTGLSATNK